LITRLLSGEYLPPENFFEGTSLRLATACFGDKGQNLVAQNFQQCGLLAELQHILNLFQGGDARYILAESVA